jgi:hypothetical protein
MGRVRGETTPNSSRSFTNAFIAKWPAVGLAGSSHGREEASVEDRLGVESVAYSSISLPPSYRNHSGMIGDSIIELPALRRGTEMQSLQRKKKKGLFREKPIFLLHTSSDSCHQSSPMRKKRIGIRQIQPSVSRVPLR